MKSCPWSAALSLASTTVGTPPRSTERRAGISRLKRSLRSLSQVDAAPPARIRPNQPRFVSARRQSCPARRLKDHERAPISRPKASSCSWRPQRWQFKLALGARAFASQVLRVPS
jgi:hypothetical protein